MRENIEQVRTTCSLCEACCASLMDVENDKIVRMRPDPADTLSAGFICAKGAAIPLLEEDPDRLRQPMIRDDGRLRPASWDEAFRLIDARLPGILSDHGRDAVAVYLGNGNGRSSGLSYMSEVVAALGTRNFYTSGTIDQIPFYAVNALLFGDEFSAPVPDLDRCRLLWIFGANPAESNGSMLTAPGILGRLKRIRDRDGRVVVFDPRRTMTARRASEYHAIRPSADAAFLAAVAQVLLAAGPARSAALDLCGDISDLRCLLAPFSPEAVAEACGIDAATIRRLAIELRDTGSAAVYGRMGTTTQHFSSLTCWLIALVNILAGNLDRVGGAMFAKPLLAQANTTGNPGRGSGARMGRWHSRVRGAPEMFGELPVSCLPEEMATPGKGQVRALIMSGANPVLSNPDPDRMTRLLRGLDLLISIDIYINESNRHAHVILPSPPRLARHQYDAYFYKFAIRTYGRYTSPYRPVRGEERSEREFLLRLAAIARGQRWDSDIDAADEASLLAMVTQEAARPGSRIEGRDPAEIMVMLRRLPPHERRLDFGFRIGPYGDAFGTRPGIAFETVRDAPAGLDLGPLEPRLPEILRTPSGTIELMQPFVPDELARLSRWLRAPRPPFVLVGRRQLRSLNSGMHNVPALDHRSRACTLNMNGRDAGALGLADGDVATVSTARGALDVAVEVTEDIASGVVCLPHGWGHAKLAGLQNVAAANPGVNINVLTDAEASDPLTGTIQVNGIAVDVVRKESAEA